MAYSIYSRLTESKNTEKQQQGDAQALQMHLLIAKFQRVVLGILSKLIKLWMQSGKYVISNMLIFQYDNDTKHTANAVQA